MGPLPPGGQPNRHRPLPAAPGEVESSASREVRVRRVGRFLRRPVRLSFRRLSGRAAGLPRLQAVSRVDQADMREGLGKVAALPLEMRVVLPGQESDVRSEEHTSELQSLMRISYAVFC